MCFSHTSTVQMTKHFQTTPGKVDERSSAQSRGMLSVEILQWLGCGEDHPILFWSSAVLIGLDRGKAAAGIKQHIRLDSPRTRERRAN